jgi:hypothetical protein
MNDHLAKKIASRWWEKRLSPEIPAAPRLAFRDSEPVFVWHPVGEASKELAFLPPDG